MDRPEEQHGVEDFLDHQEFLKRLARVLLRDPLLADDVVQETWIAARKGPAPGRPGGRAWLAGILRNRAYKARRGERRRVLREQRAARPEACDTAGEVRLALSAQRRVVSAVQGLEEPYRTAIVLRYYRDLSPPEIAARLGVPLNTVKTRLRRGLGMLRARLRRDFGGDEGAWALALAALAVGHRKGIGSGLAAGAGGAMAMKLGIGAAAAVVAGIGWWQVGAGRAAEPAASPLVASTNGPTDPDTAELAPVSLDEEARGRQAVPFQRAGIAQGAAAEPGLRLVLEPRGWREGDRGMLSIAVGTGDESEPALSFEREARPEIELDLTPLLARRVPPKLFVEIDHPSYVPATFWVIVPAPKAPGEPILVRAGVGLAPALGVVTGTVRVPEGASTPEVLVALYGLRGSGEPQDEPSERVSCAPGARFRLRSPSGGEHAVVALARASPGLGAPSLRPATARLRLEPGVPREIDPLELVHGNEISGIAASEGTERRGPGIVQAKAEGTAHFWRLDHSELDWIDGRFELRSALSPLDEEGRFAVRGLAPRLYRLQAGEVRNENERFLKLHGSPDDAPRVKAPASDVKLEPLPGNVTVLVRGAGAPLPNAGVTWLDEDGSSTTVQTDARGRASIEAGASRRLALRVRCAGFTTRELDLAPADVPRDEELVVELEPALPPGSVVIRVAEDGRALLEKSALDLFLFDLEKMPYRSGSMPVRWTPSAERAEDFAMLYPAATKLVATRHAGEIRLQDVPAGRYALVVSVARLKESTPSIVPGEFTIEVASGSATSVDWKPARGGRVRLNVKDGSGVREVRLALAAPGGGRAEMVLVALPKGSLRISGARPLLRGPGLYELAASLAPGRYRLEATPAGAAERALEFDVRAGELTDVELDLDAP
jgi:RNA polymerase sigma-70 factor (ECF subfamily)